MKKLFLFSLIVSFVVLSTTAFAAEKAPFKAALGKTNFALKVASINFTEDFVEDADANSGLYVGIEAYSELTDIAPNLYVGVETGYATTDGDLERSGDHYDTEATFVPIELNLKYAINASPNLVIDFGFGASYNYAAVEISEPAEGEAVDDDDWLFGAQVFVDLNYKINQFFVGISAKYQITENYEIASSETDVRAKNWRIGGQAGIMF